MEPLIDEVMKTEPICSKHGHGEPCVGVIVDKILQLWDKAEDHQQQLLSLANAVCRTLEDDNCFDERQDKSKHVSDITVAILNGLHLPDVCLHLGIVSDTMRPETKAFVCKYHDPLDLKPMRPMGCGCKTCSPGELCADPSKLEHICKQCSSAALKDPYSAVVIHWPMKMEVQQSLAEIWDDTLQPLMTFQYNHGTIFYGLAAMICYVDNEPIGMLDVKVDGSCLMHAEKSTGVKGPGRICLLCAGTALRQFYFTRSSNRLTEVVQVALDLFLARALCIRIPCPSPED
ncbi:uncharacterized protein [Aegilops tauschii subsp. strangulata]|uniref:uncharacterized protein n=1 Tax=Aegilops tauschii subsp. strangulata TaxID=200361 RepID=UPI003CC890FD